jgi:hypothetical protein
MWAVGSYRNTKENYSTTCWFGSNATCETIQSRYRQFQTKILDRMWASDKMWMIEYGQVFSKESYFAEIYTRWRERKTQGKLSKNFILELGVPAEQTIDGSKEQNMPGAEFSKCC